MLKRLLVLAAAVLLLAACGGATEATTATTTTAVSTTTASTTTSTTQVVTTATTTTVATTTTTAATTTTTTLPSSPVRAVLDTAWMSNWESHETFEPAQGDLPFQAGVITASWFNGGPDACVTETAPAGAGCYVLMLEGLDLDSVGPVCVGAFLWYDDLPNSGRGIDSGTSPACQWVPEGVGLGLFSEDALLACGNLVLFRTDILLNLPAGSNTERGQLDASVYIPIDQETLISGGVRGQVHTDPASTPSIDLTETNCMPAYQP